MHHSFALSQSESILKRKRIQSLFEPIAAHDVISIIAAAGAGKTQAVLSLLSHRETPVIWLPFTELDNHASHFWENFCNSLETLDSKFSKELLREGFPLESRSFHSFLKTFTERFYAHEHLSFVFDDCHLIGNTAIETFIQNFIMAEIENLTIILVSRNKNNINYFHQLSQRKLVKIGNTDLRFDRKEIEEYLALLKLSPSSEIIEDIYQKTGGWALPVSLLSRSLQTNYSSFDLTDQPQFDKIHDLIEREIFNLYSSEEKKFLIKLSLFDFLPVRYLVDVFGEDALSPFSHNLLIHFNELTNSYQFHQIFRNFLEQQQKDLSPEEIEDTQREAALWFLKYNLLIDALNCFQKIEDYDSMWDVILLMMRKAQSKEVLRFMVDVLETFPESFAYKHPLYLLSIPMIRSQFDEHLNPQLLLTQSINALRDLPQSKKRDHALGDAFLLYGLYTMRKGDIDFTKSFSQARAYLPTGSFLLPPHTLILRNGEAVLMQECQVGEMKRWCDTLASVSQDLDLLVHNNLTGLTHLARSHTAYYQGELSEAETFARQAISEGKEHTCVDIVCSGYSIVVKCAMFQGDSKSALKNLDLLKDYSLKHNKEPQFNLPDIVEGYFYAHMRRPDKIADWILNDTLYTHSLTPVNEGLERFIKAMYLAGMEDFSQLLSYMEQVEDIYIARNRHICIIRTKIAKSIAYHRLGNCTTALKQFSEACSLAIPDNIIMPFVEMGRFMRSLTELALKHNDHDISVDWLETLQRRSSTYAKRMTEMQKQLDKTSSNLMSSDLLTKRERNILQLLGSGLTREEIAEELHIAVSTVKSNLQMIYSKLGALNGPHAIKIALTNKILF